MAKKFDIHKEQQLFATWLDTLYVDVIKGGKIILEWGYPKIPGHKSLAAAAAAAFWVDQAILGAKGNE